MDFDPYQKWMNIPPSRRPPSYYDLLGISSDDAERPRIDEAAAERYEHVRKYTLGPHSEQAHRLLAELSQAVICLSDPRRKKQYDRRRRPRRIEDWPTADREPADFYELIGQPRFSPDRNRLLAAVAAAREALSKQKYDPITLNRVHRIEQELDRAKDALSRSSDYWAYHREIIARLHAAYSQVQADPGTHWRADHLQKWLQVEQSVHATRTEAVSRAMLTDEEEARLLVLGDLFARRHATTATGSERPELDMIVRQAISTVTNQALQNNRRRDV